MRKLLFIIVLIELFIMIYSKEIIKEFSLTINICLYSLMPTLFFQIFLSNILFNINISNYIPKSLCNFFNVTKDELLIILLSIFSGYPNNIRLLNNSTNEYLYYVSNYVNPLFVIGTVGTLYLYDKSLSIIILISHIISNIIMLFIFRNKYTSYEYKRNITSNLYINSINNTVKSLTIIFSNLLIISLLVTIIKLILKDSLIRGVILGLIEFSKGCFEISLLDINIYIKGLIILIFITFGSISIHMQMISFNNKIKYIKFLLFRILNVLISIIIYFLLLMNKI
ncbi:MAG: hypothetical protein IKE73_02750 [Bacilli bacterium]|nr:hypothetical protein [Bacilli bacterium]